MILVQRATKTRHLKTLETYWTVLASAPELLTNWPPGNPAELRTMHRQIGALEDHTEGEENHKGETMRIIIGE